MKNRLLLFLTITLNFNCFCQIVFEKGYYINNSNQKINCLIKNVDWKNNPNQFEYRLSDTGEIKIGTIKSIQEFGIDHISKYIRNTVDIDRSSENINELSSSKNPIFKKEVLFLNILVEGKANLYLYEEGNLKRYFYNSDNTSIKQLVHKSYLISGTKIGENNRFRNQLWNDLKCPTFKTNTVKNIKYKKRELVNFFVSYNDCANEEYTNYEKKRKKDLFNLSFRPGINSSTLSVQNSISNFRDTDFGHELAFRFGVEGELIMPFNKDTWSLIIEPIYHNFKSEAELERQTVKIDYKSIELHFGARHYFYINKKSKFFANGSLIFDLINNSVVEFEIGADLEIKTRSNLAFGLGYKNNDRYSAELRYQLSREVLSDYLSWSSDYQTFSIIFGYSIF